MRLSKRVLGIKHSAIRKFYVYANKAKTEGFRGGFYTAGFVLSLIGLIGGAIVVIVSIIAIGLISSAVTAAGGLGLSMMDICAENLTFCC